jgi:hypothetical protein
MTRSGFKEAFRRGLGSAYVELKNCTSRETYKDIVLWCCLYNTCYDSQSEGGRAVYLYNAIKLYDDKSFFEEEIIKHFVKKRIGSAAFDQLCDLLRHFALEGSAKARNALYAKYDTCFARLSRRGNEYTDEYEFERICVEITSIDGFRAFRRIVEQIGELIIKTNYKYSFDWFYTNGKNKFGRKRVEKYFHNKANSEAVEAFLKEIGSFERNTSSTNFSPTLDELITACREQGGFRCRGVAIRFSKTASEDDLNTLAQIALKETDQDIKLGMLWVFRKRRFPLDEKYVIELAESDNGAIRDIAFEMMSLLPSDRIHDYTVNLIKQKKELENALCLLCHCYKREDETLLIEGVKSISVSYGDGSWHAVFGDLENLIGKIKPSLFIYVYRRTLCSYCRAVLVEKMANKRILPREILEECLYDSNAETRKLAERKLKACLRGAHPCAPRLRGATNFT